MKSLAWDVTLKIHGNSSTAKAADFFRFNKSRVRLCKVNNFQLKQGIIHLLNKMSPFVFLLWLIFRFFATHSMENGCKIQTY